MSGRAVKKLIQTIHLWTGIILAIPMIVVGLTGSALLLQREILRYSLPDASTGPPRPILEMVEAAMPFAPPETRINWVQLPAMSGDPAGVRFVTATRPVITTEIFVDPVTLEVLGSSEFARRGPIGRVIADIHEFLMMPPHIGLPAVGWLAVALTFMCVSGLVLWWPRKGRWLAAFLVRRGARGLRLHLDLHHAVGIWGLIALTAVSVSGIYLAFPQKFNGVMRIVLPDDPAQDWALPAGVERVFPETPEAALAFAHAIVPEAKATGVQIPNANSGGTFVVQMENTGAGPSFPPITVAFNRQNEDIAFVDDPRRYSANDRMLNFQYAMHLGNGLGFIWMALVFLSGFMPLVLAITGVTIWWKKRQARRALANGTVIDAPGGAGMAIPDTAVAHETPAE